MTTDEPMECPRCHQTHERCAGHNTEGGPCGRWPTKGMQVCKKHGGGSPQAIAARDRREAEAQAVVELRAGLAMAYGDEVPDIDPAEAMLQAVSWKYAECLALRWKVAELPDDERVWGVTREKTGGDDHGTTNEAKPNIWWQMLRSAEEQLVKFAAAARAAKCDERRISVAEDAGRQLASVIRLILGDLNLSEKQQAQVSVVVPYRLRALGSGGVGVGEVPA